MGYVGEFEQLILFAVLELGDDAHGGAIRETIERRTGRLASSGAIYTALSRMGERGYVESWIGEPQEGRAGRPRKYYSLLPEGARALRDAYTSLQAMAGGLTDRLDDLAEGH